MKIHTLLALIVLAPPAGAQSLEAANKLMQMPWAGLAREKTADALKEIPKALENKKIVNGDGSVSGMKWKLHLKLEKVRASVDIANPPGLKHASFNGFAMETPLNGSWSFGVASDVEGRASVTLAGQRLFSWSPGLFRFGLRINRFKLATSADLDGNPARPSLRRATIQAQLAAGGEGFIPVSIPVSFKSQVSGGKLHLFGPVTGLGLNLPGLGGSFTGELRLSILPRQHIWNVEYEDLINVSAAVQEIEVALRGRIKVGLSRVGSQTLPFEVAFPLVIPSTEELNESILALQPPMPRILGENQPRGRTAPAPADIDAKLRDKAAAFESAIVTHLPFGAVLALDHARPPDPMIPGGEFKPIPIPGSVRPPAASQPASNPAPLPIKLPAGLKLREAPKPQSSTADDLIIGPYAYGVEADSAIWTGHYLAAESFRWASTQTPESLERVKQVVRGIKRLFDVTQDAAVMRDGVAMVRPSLLAPPRAVSPARFPVNAPGLLSRTAFASASKIGYVGKPLNQRPYYYESPEGGWEVTLQNGKTQVFPKYKDIPALHLASNRGIKPLGTVWYGWGLGDDHAVSRDQYSGVFMGLAYANQLVKDPEVKAVTQALLEQALDYLIANNWNLYIPPHNRIETTFLGNFEKQLGFLRIGKTINPAKYAAKYNELAPAAPHVWLSVWFSAVDPVAKYYKYNLLHASLGPLLMFETDPDLHQQYKTAYGVLREATGHHKNGYFNSARILAELPSNRATVAAGASDSTPGMSLRDEIRGIMAEYLKRNELVHAPSGLPVNITADPKYVADLWPAGDVMTYLTTLGGTNLLAKFPLPVYARMGRGSDFVWQRHPFATGVGKNDPQPPTPDQVRRSGSSPRREGPGVDFLLPYWMGVYLGIFQK